MEQRNYVKIPSDRIGVLIGPSGKTKRNIEESFGVDLEIDSESGSVEITLKPLNRDITDLIMVQNIVKAIGRGFNPKRAERLADEDNDMIIIDLADYAGRSRNAMDRIKGRIIGKEGSSREMLEELTGTMISVYGDTVAVIGKVDRLNITREAILMLIKGAFHKTVWNYLYAQRRKMKKEQLEIWEEQPEPKVDMK